MAQMEEIDAVTLKNWLDKGEALLVDVREQAEYREKSIPGAVCIPLATVAPSVLPPLGGKKLVIHCASGSRGKIACDKLSKELDDMPLYHLSGGISAWGNAGLPVNSSHSSHTLPLMQQVQVVTGTMVLGGVILGELFSNAFYLFPVIAGVGLIHAGLTGKCPMLNQLAKAPWNQPPSAKGVEKRKQE